MPGLRRLRDVTQRLSGALAPPRAEGEPETVDEPQQPAADEPAVPVAGGDVPGSPTADAPVDEPVAQEPVVAVPAHEEPVEEPVGPVAGQDVPAEGAAPPAVVAAAPDAVLAAAVELARAAAVEEAGEAVGEHLGVEVEPAVEGDLVVTHSFAAALPGYVGWRWAVTLARAPEQEHATVDEVVLLPGSGAIVAPEWVPWSARVAPGDLGPGDLLPPAPDDPRLVPSYEDVSADRLPFDLHRDLGLGRPRVLSAEGRALAAERWSEGPGGPGAPIAKQAPGRCVDCGFLVPLAGDLGSAFGVCANAVVPDDGRVVALLHGCGGHSETVTTAPHASTTELVVEHEELELVDVAALPADG